MTGGDEQDKTQDRADEGKKEKTTASDSMAGYCHERRRPIRYPKLPRIVLRCVFLACVRVVEGICRMM